MKKELRVLITGATGMVGEGVLHECLPCESVKEIVLVNRKRAGISHPKIKEILHDNFFDLNPIRQELGQLDACFFCLGVSSVGMKEEDYFRLTFTLTMHVAER